MEVKMMAGQRFILTSGGGGTYNYITFQGHPIRFCPFCGKQTHT
jgi:hypothetical protein